MVEKIIVSRHALARYRERFGSATEDDVLKLFSQAVRAPAWIRKVTSANSKHISYYDTFLAGQTVFVVAKGTALVIVTTLSLSWFTQHRYKKTLRNTHKFRKW